MAELNCSVIDYYDKAVISPLALLVAAIYQHRAFNVILHCGKHAEGEAAYFDIVSAMDAPTGGVSIAKAQQADTLLTDFLTVLNQSDEEVIAPFHAEAEPGGFSEQEVLSAVHLLSLLFVRASRVLRVDSQRQQVPIFSPQSIHVKYFQQATMPSMNHQLATDLSRWMSAILCGWSSA